MHGRFSTIGGAKKASRAVDGVGVSVFVFVEENEDEVGEDETRCLQRQSERGDEQDAFALGGAEPEG